MSIQSYDRARDLNKLHQEILDHAQAEIEWKRRYYYSLGVSNY